MEFELFRKEKQQSFNALPPISAKLVVFESDIWSDGLELFNLVSALDKLYGGRYTFIQIEKPLRKTSKHQGISQRAAEDGNAV